PSWYRYWSSCVSSDAGSIWSAARKRCSKSWPVRRLRSLVCTIARRLPGVWWRNSTTRHGSPFMTTTVPRLICVAGIDIIGKLLPSSDRIGTAARRRSAARSSALKVRSAAGMTQPRSPCTEHGYTAAGGRRLSPSEAAPGREGRRHQDLDRGRQHGRADGGLAGRVAVDLDRDGGFGVDGDVAGLEVDQALVAAEA